MSAESFLTWSKLTSTDADSHKFKVKIINSSPWYFDFPKAIHATGSVLSMPFALSPRDQDVFVSTGPLSTEGILTFPLKGSTQHLTLYWKVPNSVNEENMIGVYFGEEIFNNNLLQSIKKGFFSNYVPIKSKDTWISYYLDGDFSAQVMMSDQKEALGFLKISYGFRNLPAASSYYKIKLWKYPTNILIVGENALTAWAIFKVRGNYYTIRDLYTSCYIAVKNLYELGCYQADTLDITLTWEIIRLDPQRVKFRSVSSLLFLSYDSFGDLLLMADFGDADADFADTWILDSLPGVSFPIPNPQPIINRIKLAKF